MTAKAPRFNDNLSNAPLESFLSAAAKEFTADPPCSCGEPACVELSGLTTGLMRLCTLAYGRLKLADPDETAETRAQLMAMTLGDVLGHLVEALSPGAAHAVILAVAHRAAALRTNADARQTRQ